MWNICFVFFNVFLKTLDGMCKILTKKRANVHSIKKMCCVQNDDMRIMGQVRPVNKVLIK